MTKYTSEDVRKVAERLKAARSRERPAHFLIGAGCSISAGIPSARDLISRIHADYPAHCADLNEDKRGSYGACMALLSLNERRDLIKPYLENAKINWGTIALAQLMVKNFVSRVLTANFDLVLENACGLLGLQPAVYDFGVAPANDPAMIVTPSIIHLHGQSYGLVLLNTSEETSKHRQKLQPIIVDSLRNAPLIVAGYSGSADGIFQTILEEFEGRERLYWVGFDEEPQSHIAPLLREHFQFIGGADFDRFMIELAQSLGCWPPDLFSNPLKHMLEELGPVISYPVMDSESEIDLLGNLRKRLESLQRSLDEEESRQTPLKELFMKGQFGEAVDQFLLRKDSGVTSSEDQEIAAWSSIMLGNFLSERAKKTSDEEAMRLFEAAAERYETALAIKPDNHQALNNWGSLLAEQAVRASGEEATRLFEAAAEKYETALAIKSDKHETLHNWGNLLAKRAERVSGEEATRLFEAAAEKYEMALAIKPDRHGTLHKFGDLLLERAERDRGEGATRLFVAAAEKYRAALAIKPDKQESLHQLGNSLFEQAKRESSEEASRLFAAAAEKYQTALAIKPDDYEALNNFGNLLAEQATRASGEEAPQLFAAAAEKYQATLAIKPDMHQTLYNLGNLLAEQAPRASGEEASQLFAAAAEKYQAALAIKPDMHEALNNWGSLLAQQAKRASGAEAARLFAAAAEKYQAALVIKPDKHETLRNWGNLLAEQAERASGEEAARLFGAAAEKYQAAVSIKPDKYKALHTLGSLLFEQAKRTTGEEAARLFAAAGKKLAESAALDPAETYNLACLDALLGDEEQCRDHLENAKRHGTLPSKEHLIADADLASVQQKPWFQELLRDIELQ